MLNDSVTSHAIIGSAISEANRPAEIKHAVRSKYDVKETENRGLYPLLFLRPGACLLNFGDRTKTGAFRRLVRFRVTARARGPQASSFRSAVLHINITIMKLLMPIFLSLFMLSVFRGKIKGTGAAKRLMGAIYKGQVKGPR